MYLVEFNNEQVHFKIGDSLTIPDGHLFKGAMVKRSEYLAYKLQGGDWINYKGFISQFLVKGSAIIIVDNYEG